MPFERAVWLEQHVRDAPSGTRLDRNRPSAPTANRVTMGASGTDVAREADDHFGTIVNAIEQGRATFANIRRFLTYHLTDNVAELAPFAVWALSGGSIPLGLTVLQVLALDIGHRPAARARARRRAGESADHAGPAKAGRLIDGRLARRASGALFPAVVFGQLATPTPAAASPAGSAVSDSQATGC